MDILSSPIPQISISLAPPEEIPVEPYSPFATAGAFTLPYDDDDAFRPVHLTPPPTHTSFRKPLSPLRRSSTPTEAPKPTGKGLDQAQFAALLNSSKEKVTVKKDAVDLRKEVALKAHQNKQAGRRALFLSKVLAPPSPSAAVTPKTPPESPAIFHYSLPSPGLVSPITHYESLHATQTDQCKPWVEQVDFKLVNRIPTPRPRARFPQPTKTRQPLPSLEQISARLNVRQSAPTPIRIASPPSAEEAQSRIVVGRLRMPVRKNNNTPTITVSFSDEEDSEEEQAPTIPPKSPLLTTALDLQVTTMAVSRSRNVSPTEFTRANLLALNSRESRSTAMLSTLRRRTQSTTLAMAGQPMYHTDEDRRKLFRRHSAPPETMDIAKRVGFEHPVLRLPGGF